MSKTTLLWAVAACAAVIVVCLTIAAIQSRKTTIPTPAGAPPTIPPTLAAYSPPGFGLLALTALESLMVGAIIDYLVGLLLVFLLTWVFHPPIILLAVAAFVPGIPLYLWSTNLHKMYHKDRKEPDCTFRNKRGNFVPPYERGLLARVGEVIPSGPDGKGLRPGYYWFPLGDPIYGIFKTVSIKEITIPFENMEVWTKNAEQAGLGAIKGLTDGIAQFQIIDLGKYFAIQNPDVVLNAIVLESARDVCENLTMEQFLGTPNKQLSDDIEVRVRQILAKRNANMTDSLGVELISVNVKKTDNKNQEVEKGHARISVERSNVISRQIDADARKERIVGYKDTGVDANRAATLDAVVDDKAGAKISDERKFNDVGPGIIGVTTAIAEKIFPGEPK